jgi:hypothetical protein
MEVLIALVALVLVTGLLVKWARDNARREQQVLSSLRTLVEAKPTRVKKPGSE